MESDFRTRRIPQTWQRVLIALLLVGLLTVAAALRLTNINWDQFQHVHPDERFIVWVADSMTRPVDLASALDPVRSTINPFRWPPGHGDEAGKPRSYAYGHVPLYLLVVVAHAAQALGSGWARLPSRFPHSSSRCTPSGDTWRSTTISPWWDGRSRPSAIWARCC